MELYIFIGIILPVLILLKTLLVHLVPVEGSSVAEEQE